MGGGRNSSSTVTAPPFHLSCLTHKSTSTHPSQLAASGLACNAFSLTLSLNAKPAKRHRLKRTKRTLASARVKTMQKLRCALASLLPLARSTSSGRSLSAVPSFLGSHAVLGFVPSRPAPFYHRKTFSSAVNSTLPSLSEAKDVLSSQGSIRVRKALEADGRSKMSSKEFLDICRQFCTLKRVRPASVHVSLVRVAAAMAWTRFKRWTSALLCTRCVPTHACAALQTLCNSN